VRITHHFEVEKPDLRIVEYDVPGFTGPILKKLGLTLKRVFEYGHIDADSQTDLDDLFAGEGDPSVLTTVNTLLQGSISNCYKEKVKLVNKQSGTGGIIAYEITWRQISP
jgi:hypothetical protein